MIDRVKKELVESVQHKVVEGLRRQYHNDFAQWKEETHVDMGIECMALFIRGTLEDQALDKMVSRLGGFPREPSQH